VESPQAIVAREKNALAAHRASLRGGELPAPKSAPRGTFVHGLMLPLSIFMATIRSRELRGPYLRLAAIRAVVLVAIGAMALASGCSEDDKGHGVTVNHDKAATSADGPVDVDVPGFHMHLDESTNQGKMTVFGHEVPIEVSGPAATAAPAPPPPPASRFARIRDGFRRGWKAIVAFVALLSIVEGIIVFFSRRWDDWLSFYISGLAGIRPEMAEPPVRRLALDLKWLRKKLRRRIRGYIIFVAGMPLMYLLRVVPVAGDWLFTIAVTLWAWYWGGVFTASKSAHAWADDGVAPLPIVLRKFNAPFAKGWWWWPVRIYGRLLAWRLRGVNAPAATFERSPAAFLGLALARGVFALPGLYLLARPIVPVAAGRICAECDPGDRFVAAAAASGPATSSPL
jgi:hypothetical protein